MPSHDASDNQQTPLLSEVTLAALQIPQQPFGPLAPESDIHADDTSIEQIADVRQALVSGDDLLLILGESGAGKTTLLDQLGINSGQNIQCFAVRGSPRFSTLNLFAGMLEAFKRTPPEQLKDILDELIPCLQTMVARQTLSAIILDDADQINEDELTQLLSGMLYINGQDETLMRVALSAPPEFEDRIPDLLPEGADLPYSSLTIEGLDTERAAAFIDFHLRQAGYEGELPFTDDDLSQIVRESGGLPGSIKPVAANLLNQIYDPEGHPAPVAASPSQGSAFLQSRNGKLVLGAVAVVLILTGLLMFTGDSIEDEVPGSTVGETTALDTQALGGNTDRGLNRLVQSTEDTPSAATDTAGDSRDDGDGSSDARDEDASIRIVEEREVTPFRSEAIESLVPEIPVTRPNPAEDTTASSASDAGAAAGAADSADTASTSSESGGDIAANDTSPTSAASGSDTPASTSSATDATSPVPASDTDAAQVTEAAPGTGADTSSAASADIESATAAPSAAGSDATEGAAPGETSADSSAGNADPATPTAAADPDVDPDLADILESPTWILVQDADLTTVQMSASRDRPSIESFLRRNRDALPPPNSIYTFQRNGETWFALLHGLYPSFEDAQRAVEAMPDAAVTDQPWIRNVGRVQDILKAQ